MTEKQMDAMVRRGPAPYPGLTLVHAFPKGESVVNMLLYDNRVFVATNLTVYEYIDGNLVRIALIGQAA
jgi:hypothetical protein